ncbi:MAG: sulfite oxidase heme-binding subunit YedZ [Anaerolineae bacterium]
MRSWLRRNWLRLAVNLGAVVLLARLGWLLATGRFIFDPVKEITVQTGRLAIAFLLLTLTCTPLALMLGWPRLRRARRPFGLWSLAYTTLHFLTFVAWDYRLDLDLLRIGIFSQPFVLVGMSAFLLLLVLGVTSWPGLRAQMGRSWIWVQRLVYVAAVLDVWHVLWLKKRLWEAWHYPAILVILLVFRVPQVRRAVAEARHWILSSVRGSDG